MQKYLSRFRLLSQYLLSYIILLVLPVSVITFLFYPAAQSAVTNQTMANNHLVTRQVSETIDIQLTNIYGIPLRVASSDKLTPRALQKNVYAGIEALEELKGIISTNTFIHDVMLYSKSMQTLYTSVTVTPLSQYSTRNDTHKYLDIDPAGFVTMLNSQTKATILPPSRVQVSVAETRDMVTFVFPIRRTESGENDMLLVLVENNAFKKLIDVYFTEYGGNIILLDAEGNRVTAANPDDGLDMDTLVYWQSQTGGSDASLMEHEGEKYIFAAVQSGRNSWTYLSYVPRENMLGQLRNVQRATLLGTLLVLLVGGALSVLFTRRHYGPIRSLASKLPVEDLPGDQPKNELTLIQGAIQNLTADNRQLDQRIQQAVPALQEALLRGLLNGQVTSLAQFNQLGRETGLQITLPVYTVGVVSHSQAGGAVAAENFKAYFRDLAPVPEEEVYCLYDYRKNSVVVLLALPENGNGSDYFSQLQLQLEEQLELEVAVGVSESSRNFTEAGFLYIQAVSAVEVLEIQNRGGMMTSLELPTQFAGSKDYPVDALYHLEIAITKNDKKALEKASAEIVDYLTSPSSPAFLIRAVSQNALGVLVNSYHKKMGASEEMIKTEYYQLINLGAENIDKQAGIIRMYTDVLAALMENKDGLPHLLREILGYIDTHFTDPDFTIHTVALQFDTSASNISHYLRRHGDINFKQYVDDLKIGRAKLLLQTTEHTLEEITDLLGYGNVSSFIRAFKRVTSVTPGEYRRQRPGAQSGSASEETLL